MSCFIYMERSTKIWPLWIYVYNIKPQIAISYELLILSTCYVHHFIPHHFYIRKYNLVSCTTGVPTLRGPISKGVPNGHIFRWERSNRLMYVEGSCRYWVVLLHFWSSCDPLIVQIYRYSAVHTKLEVHCTYILQLIKWVELTGGGVGWGGGFVWAKWNKPWSSTGNCTIMKWVTSSNYTLCICSSIGTFLM